MYLWEVISQWHMFMIQITLVILNDTNDVFEIESGL
jgi:hypothetical protein